MSLRYTALMHEQVTPALVLARYPHGEADLRVTLFTRDLGKLTATVVSGRKPTSKLSPHLGEGSASAVRVIEQRGVRIADALTIKAEVRTLEECLLLDRILPEHVHEPSVWDAATAKKVNWASILASLGWDPASGTCGTCKGAPAAFVVRDQEFLCANHLAIVTTYPGEVILLEAHG